MLVKLHSAPQSHEKGPGLSVGASSQFQSVTFLKSGVRGTHAPSAAWPHTQLARSGLLHPARRSRQVAWRPQDPEPRRGRFPGVHSCPLELPPQLTIHLYLGPKL